MDERILTLLRDEFNRSKDSLNVASEHFDAVIREAPGGIPYPDGSQRIRDASKMLSDARDRFLEATSRLNRFIVDGIVPGAEIGRSIIE